MAQFKVVYSYLLNWYYFSDILWDGNSVTKKFNFFQQENICLIHAQTTCI